MTRRRRSKHKKSKKHHYYMPEELIEKILPNLPVKSLLRFSTASKLWNSIIFHPKFMQSYRGREVIVFKSDRQNDAGYITDNPPSACPLSSTSLDNPMAETTPFHFPPAFFLAGSCDYLWLLCRKFEGSLRLYNPSIRTYRKLPDPESAASRYSPTFVCGLGYDCANDDYKILKVSKIVYRSRELIEMYSLRSDCWRKVESPLPQFSHFLSEKGLFVSGALHWLVTRADPSIDGGEQRYILSFDLSEEKCGFIELPELQKQLVIGLDMFVFGGKLRVYMKCVDNSDDFYFSVWVMEDYESKLWMKEMEIDYGRMPLFDYYLLRPFYFYDGAGNLVRAVTSCRIRGKMFVYKEENGGCSSTATLVEKNFGSNGFGLLDSYTYVESFALFPHGSSWKDDDDDDDDEDDDDGSSRKMEELKLSS